MKAMLAVTAIVVLGTPVLGFDPGVEAITSRYKAQKLVNAADIGELMRLSERWCYAEDQGECAWSDIYLEVTTQDVRSEISNAWSEVVDISFVDRGICGDKNRLCETGEDWLPTIHARNRTDGTAIGGRELEAIKQEVATNRNESIDCFDYLYQSTDAAAETVSLLQRQYVEGVHQPDANVAVTLHFDPVNAAALKLRW